MLLWETLPVIGKSFTRIVELSSADLKKFHPDSTISPGRLTKVSPGF